MELVDVICNGSKLSPEQATQLALIIFLDLSGRELVEFPRHLFSCRALQQLLYAGNKLKMIPREMLQLESLATLYLSYNAIGFIPSLQSLPCLTSLHASENRLADFPISLPASLITLDLSRNMIPTIPPDIENLTQYP